MPLGELSKYIDTEIERLEAGQARGTLETACSALFEIQEMLPELTP